MIAQSDKIILAISGGIDSVCMLDLFLRIKSKFNLEIIVAHLNHNLRSNESDMDEIFVKNLCQSKNIIFESRKISVKDFALKNKITLEEAGRICRYNFFYELQKKYNANKISIAHNKNDNAETILMNIIRGCGALCGIKPVNGKIIRPLINITRDEIESYCAKNSLEFRIDSSNLNCEFTRNKIRNLIMPTLLEINPNLLETLVRSSKIICEESEYLNELAQKIINKFEDKNKIPIEKIDSLSKVLQSKIIHIIIKKIEPCDISSWHINSVLELKNKQNGKKIYLPHNLIAQKCFDDIIFYRDTNKNFHHQNNFKYEIQINKPVFIKQIKKKLCVSDKKLDIKNKTLCTKMFYCDNIDKITVRNYIAGDKIYFKNLGHKKLKKIFAEKKLPPQIFNSFALLAVNNVIVWIIDENIISNNDCGQKYFVSTWED
jgi:tRNA(Ile)-lysidine synthetase, N-terminal domain/tRNA(Ile)-lysidine synthetase, C-terminal domain